MMRWQLTAALAAGLVAVGALHADDQAEMRAVIDKAIKAHGGAAALDRDQAVTARSTGKYYGMGEGIPYTMTASHQRPDKYRVEISVEVMGKTFNLVQIFNGDKGWIVLDGKTVEAPKGAIDAVRQQGYESDVARLVPLRDKAFKLSPLGEVQVEGRPAVGVLVQKQGQTDVNLFFDKEKGLLVKMESRARDPMAPDTEFTNETFLSDYRKVGDQMVPFKATIKRDGKLYVEDEKSEVTAVPKLDDSLFAKP